MRRSHLLLILISFLMRASSKVAMRLRYSLMAVDDMHPLSRDTRVWTSLTFSFRTSMTAMAAYGFGPCKV